MTLFGQTKDVRVKESILPLDSFSSAPSMNITIIGAGNGGQAFAGYFSSCNHNVNLYNRSLKKLAALKNDQTIKCFGAESFEGNIKIITDKIEDAIFGAEIIFITTTADAHKQIASSMANCLTNGQLVVLNPGRTGGALEFREVLKQNHCHANVYIAEAQSLLFACRILTPGNVHIIGVKKQVPVAAYPSRDTKKIIKKLQSVHPAFCAAKNVLHTSFQNVGSIFHPGIFLFNAAAIERASKFYFYQDITPAISEFLIQLDRERLLLGDAYGIRLISLADWILKAYPDTPGNNLLELMRFNPAYYKIRAPKRLDSRYLTEDIPTGLVPFVSFGEVAGLEMPLMRSLVHISSALLKRDFWKEGRTLEKMGLADKNLTQIIEIV